MAEMTIRLICDPATGKRDVIISLRGDDDLLAHEHEQRHRDLVDKLIEGGVLQAGEVGKVVVQREAESEDEGPSPAQQPEPRHDEQQSEQQ